MESEGDRIGRNNRKNTTCSEEQQVIHLEREMRIRKANSGDFP